MIENVVCKGSTIPCDPELVDSIESAVWFFAHKDGWQYADCCDISQTAIEILLQRVSLWRSSPGSIAYRLYQDAAERHTRLQLDKLTIGAELPDCSGDRRQYLPTEKEERADRMIDFRAKMIRRDRRQMTAHLSAWVVGWLSEVAEIV